MHKLILYLKVAARYRLFITEQWGYEKMILGKEELI